MPEPPRLDDHTPRAWPKSEPDRYGETAITRAKTPLLDQIRPQVLELEYPELPAEVRRALARLSHGKAAEGVADMLTQARKHAAGKEGPLLRFDVMGRLDLRPHTVGLCQQPGRRAGMSWGTVPFTYSLR